MLVVYVDVLYVVVELNRVVYLVDDGVVEEVVKVVDVREDVIEAVVLIAADEVVAAWEDEAATAATDTAALVLATAAVPAHMPPLLKKT